MVVATRPRQTGPHLNPDVRHRNAATGVEVDSFAHVGQDVMHLPSLYLAGSRRLTATAFGPVLN